MNGRQPHNPFKKSRYEQEAEYLTEDTPTQSENAIIHAPDGSFTFKRFEFTGTALVIPENVTQQEWDEIGLLIKDVEKATVWAVADWANYAAEHWKASYEAIAEDYKYDLKTLYTYAWIARNVPTSIRNRSLTFAHHRAVAKMTPDEQLYWLSQAEIHLWTISQMKVEIAKTRKAKKRPTLSTERRYRKAFTANRKLIERELKTMGEGETELVSQIIDDQIAYLEQLKERLR